MCTVTFSPRKRGYALAMNRDEKLTRATGLPPSKKIIERRNVLAPSEPGGGTWISVNDGGVSFALINWYAVSSKVKTKSVSRGEVLKAVGSSTTALSAVEALEQLPLPRINPFRLIGFFPETNQIFEWRWDLKTLLSKQHRWRLQQWISSGFDEAKAQKIRGATFQNSVKHKSVGSLEWLRRLHRSHAPDIGAFSTCMHREDAATVSYTEITVSSRMAEMRYFDGAPCRCARGRPQAHMLNQIR
jgi:Transport and Golgi organisation 2